MIEEIDIDNRSGSELGEKEQELLILAVKAAAKALCNSTIGYQVSVSIVADDEIHSLNREWRGIDKPTDVLSFPMGEADGRGVELLGDIVLNLEMAKSQAVEYGHAFERELCYLCVHSMLHLAGYDHETEEEKGQMRNMEEGFMNELGLGQMNK